MSDMERELAAALQAQSASVTPDPQAWEKHRSAALARPVSARGWFGQRRSLPLLIAAAVVFLAAVGTSIVVTNTSSAPAGAPAPATGQVPTAAATPPPASSARPAAIAAATVGSATTVTVAVPALTCTGILLGSAQLTPAVVTGFTARLQLHRSAGGDVLCAGIDGAAGSTVQTSSGGTVTGTGPLDLAASSSWDQGSPVFVWGAVDGRVTGVHVTGANGTAVQVQFAALPSGRRAFLAVLAANTKTATATATDTNGRLVTTRQLTTTFGQPDTLNTLTPVPTTTSAPPAATAPPTGTPPTAAPATEPPSTTNPPPSPLGGCDGAGTGIGIADLGVGSGMVSFNYLPADSALCFSNGGPLKIQHRVPGVVPYAGRTTLVSGPGVWGAVTRNVATVTITDLDSPKGRAAQLLPLGSDLKVFVEATAGPVHLQAFNAAGARLYDLTLR